jgi:hypothetical protein
VLLPHVLLAHRLVVDVVLRGHAPLDEVLKRRRWKR